MCVLVKIYSCWVLLWFLKNIFLHLFIYLFIYVVCLLRLWRKWRAPTPPSLSAAAQQRNEKKQTHTDTQRVTETRRQPLPRVYRVLRAEQSHDERGAAPAGLPVLLLGGSGGPVPGRHGAGGPGAGPAEAETAGLAKSTPGRRARPAAPPGLGETPPERSRRPGPQHRVLVRVLSF